jgi:hypothetical protein
MNQNVQPRALSFADCGLPVKKQADLFFCLRRVCRSIVNSFRWVILLVPLTGCGLLPSKECPSGTPNPLTVEFVARANAASWLPSKSPQLETALIDELLKGGCCSLQPVKPTWLEYILERNDSRPYYVFKSKSPRALVTKKSNKSASFISDAKINNCGRFITVMQGSFYNS